VRVGKKGRRTGESETGEEGVENGGIVSEGTGGEEVSVDLKRLAERGGGVYEREGTVVRY
jgi:hypothetical protein